jgi:hypothetical protein
VLRTPAFVDRMELNEDAEDRVAIFGVEGGSPQPVATGRARPRGEAAHTVSLRLAAALDSRWAAPVLAVVLLAVFLLGMLLRR